MRRCALISLLALLGFSSSAVAGSNVGNHLGQVGDISLDGPVSVPLYGTATDSVLPAVNATINGDEEKTFFFALSSRTAIISVSDEIVAAYELKVREKRDGVGGKIKTVQIDSIAIGGLVLNDVTAVVHSSASKPGGTVAAVQLGMGALDLAYAISPSEGTVTFASPDGGAALASAISDGGTTLSYSAVDWDRVVFGKTGPKLLDDKVKKIQPARTLLVAGQVGGLDAQMALEVGGLSAYSPALDVRSEVVNSNGADAYAHWLSAQVGALALSETWFALNSSFERGTFHHDALLGSDVLSGFDMAVDPANGTVTLRAATSQNRSDPAEIQLTEAIAAAEKAEAPPEGEEAPASTEGEEDAGNPAAAGAWATVARMQASQGDYDSALNSWVKVIELDDTSCTNWMAYGLTQLESGHAQGASESYARAADAYHSWWDIDRATRMLIQEHAALDATKNPLKKLGGMFLDDVPAEHAEATPVPGACHVADAGLAAANLVLGNLDEVASLYSAHLDLDPGLARIQGNALINAGETTVAQGPLRQALKLEGSPDALNRLGLALTYADQGNWDTAGPLFEKALEINHADSMAVTLWLDNLRAQTEPAVTVKAALQWRNARPTSAAAHFGLVREAHISGLERFVAPAEEAAAAYFADALVLHPRDARLWAIHARTLVWMGNLEEARTAAEMAIQLQPGLAASWIAMADVTSMEGDETRAISLLHRAGEVEPSHPGYAMLLNARAQPARPARDDSPAPEGTPEETPEEDAPAEE